MWTVLWWGSDKIRGAISRVDQRLGCWLELVEERAWIFAGEETTAIRSILQARQDSRSGTGYGNAAFIC